MSEENLENNVSAENKEVVPNNAEIVDKVCENADDTDGITAQDTVQECDSAIADTESPGPRKKIRIPLGAYIISTLAFILATLMVTYTVCSSLYQKQKADIYAEIASDSTPNSSQTGLGGWSEITIIDYLLDNYFYGEVDRDKLTEDSLKAYLAATGDIYAAYYTQEELDSLNDEGAGKMQGIGVNVINSKVTLSGTEYAVLKIINVSKGSPAEESGIKVGDLIFSVINDSGKDLVNKLGYDETLRQLKGLSGTVAKFSILRKSGDSYEEKSFSVTRREVISQSVYHRVSTLDQKVGVIRISNFDLTTPSQFEQAVEDLKSKGCEKFVLDMRYNPGGYLISVAAVLSFFLEEGDVYIRTEDKNKKVETKTVGVVSDFKDDYADCNVTKEDIGKYKDLNLVVICNEYTASAGELFTATMRDYDLGKIVGTTTFGKGTMQNTYSLEIFGMEGAVKFTTHKYYSAKSEGYDGVGIKPDEGCEVALSDAALEYNIYDLPDDKDDQLVEAIKHFK